MKLERDPAGRMTRVVDRDGAVHAEVSWDGEAARVSVALGRQGAVAVAGRW